MFEIIRKEVQKTMSIFSVFSLLGGLAFFLYGMTTMSSSLEKMAGGKLEGGLRKVTSNKLKSLLFGAGITIAVQSSSAVTVMLVGFVNSGIMTLKQTIGIIMGSNIGTTLTAWILSMAGIDSDKNLVLSFLKPENFTPLIAFVGIIMVMVSNCKKQKDIGNIFLGFSILMFGMTLMSNAVKPLGNMPEFANILVYFKNPFLGVLVGTVFTGVIQSSAASVGILQALSLTGKVTYGMAIPVIMGQNIGTCVTALLSSIGVSKNAKRVAVVHIYFNIIGTILCLLVFYGLNGLLGFGFVAKKIGPVGIAGIHTLFNIITTIVLIPFTKVLEELARLTVKDNDENKEKVFIDERILATPSVAIAECKNHMDKMVEITKESVKISIELIKEYNSEKMSKIWENEEIIDSYEDNLGTYLLKLGGNDISEKDNRKVNTILHILGDVERIGDHALNISKLAAELYNKKKDFSMDAKIEIDILLKALDEIVNLTVIAYTDNDIIKAEKVEPLEQVIDMLCDDMKENHISRLRKGVCTIETGFVFNDLVANVQRISDHCSNIAVCLLRVRESELNTHEYLQEIKSDVDGSFSMYFRYFKNKYIIRV